MNSITIQLYILFCMSLLSCQNNKQRNVESAEESVAMKFQTIGEINRIDPIINNLIDPDAAIEILADGYEWTEGPVWVPQLNGVLFCDIPPNKIHYWTEGQEAETWLTPSGYTGSVARGGEVGSNGLTLDANQQLVMCQHGDRRIARLTASYDAPIANYETIADRYNGQRFNSPNDVIFRSNGDIYFTDPPYGLEFQMDDPTKEIDFQGVYMIDKGGKVTLLTDELSRPNGLAFSPDEKTLYVANSDPNKAIWMAYDVMDNGLLENGRIFYDASDRVATSMGLPDGMKVDVDGYIYATGPGGVYVFDNQAKLLGMIETTQATSNCTFGGVDFNELFITADRYLLRLKVNSVGTKAFK